MGVLHTQSGPVLTGRDASLAIRAKLRAGEPADGVWTAADVRRQLARAVRFIEANQDRAPVARLEVKPWEE